MPTLDQFNLPPTSNDGNGLRFSSSFEKLAFSFVPSNSGFVTEWHSLLSNYSSVTGNCWVAIYTDSSSLPGTQIGSVSDSLDVSTIVSKDDFLNGSDETFTWSSGQPAITASTTYWLVFEGDYTPNGTDYVSNASDNTGTDATGGQSQVKRWDGSAWQNSSAAYTFFEQYYDASIGFEISVSDSITVSENVALAVTGTPPDLDVSVSDSVTVSENVSVFVPVPDLDLSVSDSITVSESVNASFFLSPLSVSVSDSVTVTEPSYIALSLCSPAFGQIFTDNFNRADSSNLGADWTEVTGSSSIGTNRLYADIAASELYWNTLPDGADQYAEFVVVDGYDLSGTRPQIALRLVSDFDTGYLAMWRVDQDDIIIFRIDSGVFNQIATSVIGTALANDDVLRLEVEDNGSGNPVITAYHNGNNIVSHEDTSGSKITANGYLGIRMTLVNRAYLDDWEAGDLNAVEGAYCILVDEIVQVTESVNLEIVTAPYEVSVSDSTTISENVSIVVIGDPPDLLITATDTPTVSENVTIDIQDATALDASTSDTATISESVNVFIGEPEVQVQASDTVTVTDTPAVAAPVFADLEIHAKEPSYSNGYRHRRTVTIERIKIWRTDVGTDQAEFHQIQIKGTYPYLATKANGGNVDSGNDIIFTDDGDTLLDFYIVDYEPTTGYIFAIVEVPDVNSSLLTTNTIFYMYYGQFNQSSSEDRNASWNVAEGAGTFDDKYAVVINADSGYIEDSRGTTVTNNGATITSGKWGDAFSFTASESDYVEIADHVSQRQGNGLLISMWVKFSSNDIGSTVSLASKMDSNDNGWIIGKNSSDGMFIARSNGFGNPLNVQTQLTPVVFSSDTWYFLSWLNASALGSGSMMVAQQIKSLSPSSTASTNTNNSSPVWLGGDEQGVYSHFDGEIDEFKLVSFDEADIEDPTQNSSRNHYLATVNATPDQYSIGEDDAAQIVVDTPILAVFPHEVVATDNVIVNENVNIFVNLPTPTPSVSDTATISENVQIQIGIPFPTPSVSDSVAVSESVLVEIEIEVQASDGTTVTDTPTVDEPFTIPFTLSVLDTVTVSESVILSAPDVNPGTSDTITLSENVNLALTLNASASELVAVGEVVGIVLDDLEVYAQDITTITEGIGGIVPPLTINVSDSVTVSESINFTKPTRGRTSDLIQVFDFPDIQLQIDVYASDSTTISEAIVANEILKVVASDTVTVTDTPQLPFFLVKIYASDTVTVFDFNAIIVREPPDFKPLIEEIVTVIEGEISISILDPGALGITVGDVVTVTETHNVELPFPGIHVTDSVTVSDFPTAVTPTVLFVNVIDNIIVNDLFPPEAIDIVVPPDFHEIHVYDVTVVTEQWVVDRDIWGGNIPDEESDGWSEGDSPTTVYKEIDDPTTEWRDADEHER